MVKRIPGPTLIVHEGQEVEIHVKYNPTSEGISIHWHWMHQIGKMFVTAPIQLFIEASCQSFWGVLVPFSKANRFFYFTFLEY